MCCRSKRLWQWRHQEHPVQAAEEGVDQDPQWSRLQMGGDSHRLQSPGSPTSVSTATCHHHCIQTTATSRWHCCECRPVMVHLHQFFWQWKRPQQSCPGPVQRPARGALLQDQRQQGRFCSCSLTSLWQSKYSNIADLEQFFLHSTFWTCSKFFHI